MVKSEDTFLVAYLQTKSTAELSHCMKWLLGLFRSGLLPNIPGLTPTKRNILILYHVLDLPLHGDEKQNNKIQQ